MSRPLCPGCKRPHEACLCGQTVAPQTTDGLAALRARCATPEGEARALGILVGEATDPLPSDITGLSPEADSIYRALIALGALQETEPGYAYMRRDVRTEVARDGARAWLRARLFAASPAEEPDLDAWKREAQAVCAERPHRTIISHASPSGVTNTAIDPHELATRLLTLIERVRTAEGEVARLREALQAENAGRLQAVSLHAAAHTKLKRADEEIARLKAERGELAKRFETEAKASTIVGARIWRRAARIARGEES